MLRHSRGSSRILDHGAAFLDLYPWADPGHLDFATVTLEPPERPVRRLEAGDWFDVAVAGVERPLLGLVVASSTWANQRTFSLCFASADRPDELLVPPVRIPRRSFGRPGAGFTFGGSELAPFAEIPALAWPTPPGPPHAHEDDGGAPLDDASGRLVGLSSLLLPDGLAQLLVVGAHLSDSMGS